MTTDTRGDFITQQIEQIQSWLKTPPTPSSTLFQTQTIDERGDFITRQIEEYKQV